VAAGYRPEVVTGLGFPRADGVTHVAEEEVVEEMPHHRLDLGPFYPLDGPLDRRLRDAAWLAAAVGARVRPAMIHAVLDGPGLAVALVATAVARHLERPIVVDVLADGGAVLTVDASRTQATVTEAMRTADHVIMATEAMRDRLLERGLEASRVTVVPVSRDGASNRERLHDVYAEVAARHAAATNA